MLVQELGNCLSTEHGLKMIIVPKISQENLCETTWSTTCRYMANAAASKGMGVGLFAGWSPSFAQNPTAV